MQAILSQVGELLLGSIPTLILFLLLVIAYQVLVQGPLGRTLAERRSRTAGAVEAAHKAIAAAGGKADDYAIKLREARMEIFKVREARLKTWNEDRDAQLDSARKSASQRVADAKIEIMKDADEARKALLASADQLAEQVVRAVLPATAGGTR
jgi:F-type H+-transporting ATPase subunit b